jgi:hypothetical protein
MKIEAATRTAILNAITTKFPSCITTHAQVEVLQRRFSATFEYLPLYAQASIREGDKTPRYGVTVGQEKYVAMQRDDASWFAIEATEVPEFQFAS